MKQLTAIGLYALAVVLLSPAALAHDRSVSYSVWTLTDLGGTVTVRFRSLDMTRLRTLPESNKSYFMQRLLLHAATAECAAIPSSFVELEVEAGWSVRSWTVACTKAARPTAVSSDLFVDEIPEHLHFVRLRGGAGLAEQVLDFGRRRWELPAAEGPSSPSFLRFVTLGVEHILTGYDHLVFVLALLLGSRKLWQVAAVVTGFTIGHSATLALAVLGKVSPVASVVESLIGASIAVVAVENVWLARARTGVSLPGAVVASAAVCAAVTAYSSREGALALAGLGVFTAGYFGLLGRATRPESLRGGVACLFGLVHGFGFAGVLAEAHLEPGRLASGLLGFNLGVEAGQLAVVLLAWPLFTVLRRRWENGVLIVGSSAALSVGVYWFVMRAFA